MISKPCDRVAGHESILLQVIGVLLMVLLEQRHGVGAACFNGSYINGTWISTGCSLPEPAYASQCLGARNVLFMGDSSIRNLFNKLCDHLKVEAQRHPCNMRMGWGCHDCVRGCHSPEYFESQKQLNWHDAYAVTAAGMRLTYTWKPEMLTADDIIFLKSFTALNDGIMAAVVVHKGVHEALDLQRALKPGIYPEDEFTLEISARAEVLARSLKEYFPNAALFWKEAYHNVKDAEVEGLNQRLRLPVEACFRQQGFYMLPGHHVSKTANVYYPENDGFHPHKSVDDVMISMIADVLCP